MLQNSNTIIFANHKALLTQGFTAHLWKIRHLHKKRDKTIIGVYYPNIINERFFREKFKN